MIQTSGGSEKIHRVRAAIYLGQDNGTDCGVGVVVVVSRGVVDFLALTNETNELLEKFCMVE